MSVVLAVEEHRLRVATFLMCRSLPPTLSRSVRETCALRMCCLFLLMVRCMLTYMWCRKLSLLLLMGLLLVVCTMRNMWWCLVTLLRLTRVFA